MVDGKTLKYHDQMTSKQRYINVDSVGKTLKQRRSNVVYRRRKHGDKTTSSKHSFSTKFRRCCNVRERRCFDVVSTLLEHSIFAHPNFAHIHFSRTPSRVIENQGFIHDLMISFINIMLQERIVLYAGL